MLLPGFFVDLNLFKASKERAAEFAKETDAVFKTLNESNGASGKDGLADEDANLMIKLKFLTYKVCVLQRLTYEMVWLLPDLLFFNELTICMYLTPLFGGN